MSTLILIHLKTTFSLKNAFRSVWMRKFSNENILVWTWPERAQSCISWTFNWQACVQCCMQKQRSA